MNGVDCFSESAIAIMQPYFFPYIGYFQLIKAVDIFVIYEDVNYINKSYINRNSILVNGMPHQITLALSGASQNKLINQIEIADNSKKIIKTIEMAYKKAPLFNTIFPILSDILLTQEKNLSKMLLYSIRAISNYLELKTKFIFSSSIDKNNMLKGGDKLIAICQKMNFRNYINSIGGQILYDKQTFKNQQINLFFLKTLPFTYKQFNNAYIPNLSIIDLLMFNEKDKLLEAMEEYILI